MKNWYTEIDGRSVPLTSIRNSVKCEVESTEGSVKPGECSMKDASLSLRSLRSLRCRPLTYLLAKGKPTTDFFLFLFSLFCFVGLSSSSSSSSSFVRCLRLRRLCLLPLRLRCLRLRVGVCMCVHVRVRECVRARASKSA